jgi:hypothetical protein
LGNTSWMLVGGGSQLVKLPVISKSGVVVLR